MQLHYIFSFHCYNMKICSCILVIFVIATITATVTVTATVTTTTKEEEESTITKTCTTPDEKKETSTVSLHWATPIYKSWLWKENLNEQNMMLDKLREIALVLEEQTESASKSNAGGFQSYLLYKENLQDSEILENLEREIIRAAGQFYVAGLDESQTSDGGARKKAFLQGEGGKLEISSLWFNVNRGSDSNVAHTHADSFISGAFYVDTGVKDPIDDQDGAAIIFSDPRVQAVHNSVYADWFGTARGLPIVPQKGNIVMFPSWLVHRVESLFEEGPRISIAFNLRLTKN